MSQTRAVLFSVFLYTTCLRLILADVAVGSRTIFGPPGLNIAKQAGEQPILHFMQNNPGSFDYVPRPKDLKTKRLLRRLGTDFNPKFMSVDKPGQSYLDKQSGFHPDVQLYKQFDSLNFTVINNKGELIKIKPKIIKMMKRWLLQKSSCQVTFKWYDLGVFFWPRWIKHGACSLDSTCSFPRGMSCVPSESRRLTILRWRCRRTRKVVDNHLAINPRTTFRGPRRRCKWRKIPFPVLDECHCGC